jgi:hypothetical protein
MLTLLLTLLMADQPNKPKVVLLSPEKQAEWLSVLPQTKSGRLEKALSMEFVMYDEEVMPSAFQRENNALSTYHSSSYNLAGNLDPLGHPNSEHPWKTGLGLDKCDGAVQIKIISFPREKLPLKWSWEMIEGANDSSEAYSPGGNPINKVRYLKYPEGTATVEVIAVRDPDTKKLLPQIIRTRIKQEDGSYTVAVEAPFASSGEFLNFIRNNGSPEDIRAVNEHYRLPEVPVRRTLLPKLGGKLPFRTTAPKEYYDCIEDKIPPLDKGLIRKILSRTFVKMDEAKPWRAAADDRLNTYAPTTDSDFSFVPKNYAGDSFPQPKQAVWPVTARHWLP